MKPFRTVGAGLLSFAAIACGAPQEPAKPAGATMTVPDGGASIASPGGPSPCDRARASRTTAVPAFLSQGKLDRAMRTLATADAQCPESARDSVALRDSIVALLLQSPAVTGEKAEADARALFWQAEDKEAAQDFAGARALYESAWKTSHPNGAALARAGLMAAKSGDQPAAQRLFDRAAIDLAKETNEPPKPKLPVSEYGGRAALSPDGQSAAVIRGSSELALWRRGEVRARIKLTSSPEEMVFSKDGHELALVLRTKIDVLSAATGKTIRSTPIPSPASGTTETHDLGDDLSIALTAVRTTTKDKGVEYKFRDAAGAARGTISLPDIDRLIALRRAGDAVVAIYSVRTGTSKEERRKAPAPAGGMNARVAPTTATLGSLQMAPLSALGGGGSDPYHVRVIDQTTRVIGVRLDLKSGQTKRKELVALKLRTVEPFEPSRSLSPEPPMGGDPNQVIYDDYKGEEPGQSAISADLSTFALSVAAIFSGSRAAATRVMQFDLESGTKIGEIPVPEGINHLALTPKGDAMVWSKGNSTRELRSDPIASRGGATWVLPMEMNPSALAFSADGTRLAALPDAGIDIVDTKAGRVVSRVGASVHYGSELVAASPDGSTLAIAATDQSVRLFHPNDGTTITIPGHVHIASNFAFSHDGRSLAVAYSARGSGNDDHVLRVFATKDAAPTGTVQLPNLGVWDLAWTADDKGLSVATKTTSLQTFDVGTGAARPPLTMAGLTEITQVSHCGSRARTLLGAKNGAVVVETDTGRTVAQGSDPGVTAARLSTDCTTALVSHTKGFEAYDVETLAPRWTIKEGHGARMIVVGATNRDVAVAGPDFRIADLASGAARTWNGNRQASSATFFGDRVVVTTDKGIFVRDAKSGDEVASIALHKGTTVTLATGEIAGDLDPAFECGAGPLRFPLDVCKERYVDAAAVVAAFTSP